MISEREYLKLRAEIENRCRLDIEALDRVWSMAYKGTPPRQKPKPQSSTRAITKVLEKVNDALEVVNDSLNKRGAVREVIRSFTGAFGSKDVRAALEAHNPEASRMINDNQLSSIIARLADLDEIHIMVPKSGRTAAVYVPGPKPAEVKAL